MEHQFNCLRVDLTATAKRIVPSRPDRRLDLLSSSWSINPRVPDTGSHVTNRMRQVTWFQKKFVWFEQHSELNRQTKNVSSISWNVAVPPDNTTCCGKSWCVRVAICRTRNTARQVACKLVRNFLKRVSATTSQCPSRNGTAGAGRGCNPLHLRQLFRWLSN